MQSTARQDPSRRGTFLQVLLKTVRQTARQTGLQAVQLTFRHNTLFSPLSYDRSLDRSPDRSSDISSQHVLQTAANTVRQTIRHVTFFRLFSRPFSRPSSRLCKQGRKTTKKIKMTTTISCIYECMPESRKKNYEVQKKHQHTYTCPHLVVKSQSVPLVQVLDQSHGLLPFLVRVLRIRDFLGTFFGPFLSLAFRSSSPTSNSFATATAIASAFLDARD